VTCDSSLTVINVQEGSTPNNNITKSEFDIVMFPNPVEDFTRVAFTLEKRDAVSIAIMDVNGQVISSEKETFPAGRSFKTLQTDHLPDGNYIFQMVIGGQIYNQKFVKVQAE